MSVRLLVISLAWITLDFVCLARVLNVVWMYIIYHYAAPAYTYIYIYILSQFRNCYSCTAVTRVRTQGGAQHPSVVWCGHVAPQSWHNVTVVYPRFGAAAACKMFHSISRDNVEAMAHSIGKRGGYVDITNEFGVTPLHIAASSGSCRCAEYLLKKKADVSMQDKESKWTPLHRAVFSLTEQSCRMPLLLIKYKANLHMPRDKDGLTPLQLLSQKLWFQRCNGNTLFELPDIRAFIRMRPGYNHSMTVPGKKSIASARGSAISGQLFAIGSWDSGGRGYVTCPLCAPISLYR